MLCIKLETKRKITYPENFFWFLETVGFSTSAPAVTYWQQTWPSKANFAFPRTQKLWRWTKRKSPIFASKVKSLVGCSYSFPIRPYCMLHSCFQIHAFSLEVLGGTLKLISAWVSPSEALSLVLKARCNRQKQDPFSISLSSFPSEPLSAACYAFLVHVCFPPSALFIPVIPLSFLLCFNFSWIILTFLSLIARAAFGGCKDDWYRRSNRSTNWYHKWLI